MSNIEPEADGTSEAGSAETAEAQSADDTSGLIMAEVADAGLQRRLDDREAVIGERKEMGPPLDFDDAELALAPATDVGDGDDQEVTPIPLAEGE